MFLQVHWEILTNDTRLKMCHLKKMFTLLSEVTYLCFEQIVIAEKLCTLCVYSCYFLLPLLEHVYKVVVFRAL